MDTKTITFEGREYKVPVWVEWVARDEDSSIYGYENKPDVYEGVFISPKPKSIFIARNYVDFRVSLTKV